MSKYRKRAAKLVAQMTLEEKVSQTLFEAPAIERLHIPAYNWWNEALHGVARAGTATVFPQAIGVAATFDEELAGRMAAVIADEAVTNLMECRLKLGMFEDEGSVPFDHIGYEHVDTKENRALNLEVARKSLVLLKNENGLLPLDRTKIRSIGVIGPNAASRKVLVGNYEGTASRYITVLEGIQDYVGDEVRVYYSEGCHLYKECGDGQSKNGERFSEVKAVCEVSDVLVLVMGLDASLEGEQGDASNVYASGDKINLDLPGLQSEVIRIAYESKKPVILVSMSGSALALNWEDDHIPAIIQAWYPGAQGGRAVAELIFGAYSPEGKLPVTFYRSTEELPPFTDYAMKGRTYRYMKQEALYPFGYGLSYTEFEVTGVKADSDRIVPGGSIHVDVTIKNTGAAAGGETVQLYVKALRENTPNAQLKGLKKVFLQPGEEQTVHIVLKDSAFALYNEKADAVLEAGEYAVYVGTQQPDNRSRMLTQKDCTELRICCDKTERL